MKFSVFYANNFAFSALVPAIPETVNIDDYRRIEPRVDADTLDDVFRQMNVVDGDELPAKLGIRSMSVGDVIVDNAGLAFIVAPVGFEAVKFVLAATLG